MSQHGSAPASKIVGVSVILVADLIALRPDSWPLLARCGNTCARVTHGLTHASGAARPRRRRRRLLVGLFAGLIAIPTAAAAVVDGMPHSASSSPTPLPYGSMNVPGEEWMKANDPEIHTVVHGLTSGFPLPPDASYSLLLKRYPSKMDGRVQRRRTSPRLWPTTPTARGISLGSTASRHSAPQTSPPSMPYRPGRTENWAVDNATGENGRLDWLNGIAAETRIGKTTKITQEMRVNCGYGPGMWEETPAPSPRP